MIAIEPNKIITGDCLDVLRGMETESVDAIITDPPYGIAFQSKHRADRFNRVTGDKKPFIWWLWDASRVLKDGGWSSVFPDGTHKAPSLMPWAWLALR